MKKLLFLCLLPFLLTSEELLLKEIEIRGPGGEEKELKEFLLPFIGEPLTSALLEGIKQQALAFYKNGCVTVEIPDQNVTEGCIYIELQRAKVNRVSFCGKEPTYKMEKFFSLYNGDVLDEERLMNNIAWFNRNPFRSAKAILSPGNQEGWADVEFVTQDRSPWRIFTGADNTGTSFTDRARLYAGFNWGNALLIRDLFTYQFTCAPTPRRFWAHTFSYSSFLPWKHQLNVYGGFAEIHPKITSFRNEGKNYQGSVRYEIPFKPLYAPFQQQVAFGADFKNLNSNLFFISTFEEIPVIAQQANLFQFCTIYTFYWTLPKHVWTFKTELFGSPFRFLPHQNKQVYDELRADASPFYGYMRAALGDLYTPSKWFTLSWLFRGQASTGALLPSEQFGLGGSDTVRGYEERSFNSDMALCGNLELQTGRFSIFPYSKVDAYFLAFVDLAKGWNWHPQEADLKTQNLAGTGAGLRVNWLPYIIGRIDYGVKLHSIPGDDRFGRYHASLSLSY